VLVPIGRHSDRLIAESLCYFTGSLCSRAIQNENVLTVDSFANIHSAALAIGGLPVPSIDTA
jgi:hypothetical protein